jgi:hypothetical protein
LLDAGERRNLRKICAKLLACDVAGNMAVVRLLKWLEVKDERIKNFIFHDFIELRANSSRSLSEKLSPAIGSRSRPVLKD